jgi:hypothetical protein
MKEEIPGEVKRCVALQSFVFQGEQILEGQKLELDSDTFIEMSSGSRTPRLQMLSGGCLKVEPMRDGFHKLSPWGQNSW